MSALYYRGRQSLGIVKRHPDGRVVQATPRSARETPALSDVLVQYLLCTVSLSYDDCGIGAGENIVIQRKPFPSDFLAFYVSVLKTP